MLPSLVRSVVGEVALDEARREVAELRRAVDATVLNEERMRGVVVLVAEVGVVVVGAGAACAVAVGVATRGNPTSVAEWGGALAAVAVVVGFTVAAQVVLRRNYGPQQPKAAPQATPPSMPVIPPVVPPFLLPRASVLVPTAAPAATSPSPPPPQTKAHEAPANTLIDRLASTPAGTTDVPAYVRAPSGFLVWTAADGLVRTGPDQRTELHPAARLLLRPLRVTSSTNSAVVEIRHACSSRVFRALGNGNGDVAFDAAPGAAPTPVEIRELSDGRVVLRLQGNDGASRTLAEREDGSVHARDGPPHRNDTFLVQLEAVARAPDMPPPSLYARLATLKPGAFYPVRLRAHDGHYASPRNGAMQCREPLPRPGSGTTLFLQRSVAKKNGGVGTFSLVTDAPAFSFVSVTPAGSVESNRLLPRAWEEFSVEAVEPSLDEDWFIVDPRRERCRVRSTAHGTFLRCKEDGVVDAVAVGGPMEVFFLQVDVDAAIEPTAPLRPGQRVSLWSTRPVHMPLRMNADGVLFVPVPRESSRAETTSTTTTGTATEFVVEAGSSDGTLALRAASTGALLCVEDHAATSFASFLPVASVAASTRAVVVNRRGAPGAWESLRVSWLPSSAQAHQALRGVHGQGHVEGLARVVGATAASAVVRVKPDGVVDAVVPSAAADPFESDAAGLAAATVVLVRVVSDFSPGQ